ncbi:hypothetical protein ABIE91_005215 [Bradyrhizobium elkanii]
MRNLPCAPLLPSCPMESFIDNNNNKNPNEKSPVKNRKGRITSIPAINPVKVRQSPKIGLNQATTGMRLRTERSPREGNARSNDFVVSMRKSNEGRSLARRNENVSGEVSLWRRNLARSRTVSHTALRCNARRVGSRGRPRSEVAQQTDSGCRGQDFLQGKITSELWAEPKPQALVASDA